MTGGVVAILGETGVNFGAGMTGGRAFVYDTKGGFFEKINTELVEIVRIDTDEYDTEMFELKNLIKDYYSKTQSEVANFILENFRTEVRKFWMVIPRGTQPTIEIEKKGE
jgi:glutamate synthase (NADPH/NADH) large chain